jgi:microcompartment protein CcmK/EutM
LHDLHITNCEFRDNTQAGIGDTVLVLREGSGARQVLRNPDACIISVIVGIIDQVEA